MAAVERILARVTAARERLNRVPATLRRFRQAVLAAACSGRIATEGDVEFVPLDGLSSASTESAPDPELLTVSQLESLPSHWQIVRLDMLRDQERGISYGVLKPGPYVEGGVPLLRIVDIETGVASLTDVHRVGTDLSQQYSRTILRGAEVVVSLVGTIGRVATVPQELQGANIHRNLAMVAPSPAVDPWYLSFALSSCWLQKQIEFVTVGASQPLLNLGDLKRLLVPFPPIEEQQAIVRRVRAAFALADRIEAKLSAARQRVNALTQAVLAKAFRGELVATEVELARHEGREYEPASALLERIRKERSQSAPARPRRSKG